MTGIVKEILYGREIWEGDGRVMDCTYTRPQSLAETRNQEIKGGNRKRRTHFYSFPFMFAMTLIFNTIFMVYTSH